jgi:hypothetical protein
MLEGDSKWQSKCQSVVEGIGPIKGQKFIHNDKIVEYGTIIIEKKISDKIIFAKNSQKIFNIVKSRNSSICNVYFCEK